MIKPTTVQMTAIDEGRYRHFVRFTLDSLNTLTIGEDEIRENGFKVDQAVSGRSAFELGACVVNQFTVEIYNPAGTYQNTDFLGKPVYAYIDLYDTDGTTVIGTISKGHYIVDKADTNGGVIKLTCLDMLSTLDRPYTDVNTAYPATLYDIVSDIATLAGLTLSLDGVNWLPSGITSSYKVTVRPTEVTCRDVLSAVCQATGNYATIDRLGQLLITRYDTAFIAETGSDYSGYDYDEIDPSVLFNLTRAEAQVTLTGVSVEVGEDAYTAGTDDYMIHIVDNPIVNAGSEQTFATALNTLVNGWNFRPFEADCRRNMCMEAGDNVIVTDALGNVYKSIITHVEYEAGKKQSVECNAEPAAVQSSTRYSQAAKAAAQTVKVYDSTVNNYIGLVSKGMGMYRSLITDPDDPTQQIYAFHNDETIGDSTFCMFENSNGIQVGRRDTTSDPWVYTSADVEDAVVLAQTLVANTAIINALFSNDVTVTGALHSSDYVPASPGASPPYAQAGMGLDFGDKEFEAENFAVDASGNLYAKGATFEDVNVTGGTITLESGTAARLTILNEDDDAYGSSFSWRRWLMNWHDPNDPTGLEYYLFRFDKGVMTGLPEEHSARAQIDFQNGTIYALSDITTDGYVNGLLSVPSAAGFTMDAHGRFKHNRATTTDVWRIFNNAGTSVFGINYESGAIDSDFLIRKATSVNITNGSANDTHSFWVSQRSCYVFFSQTGMLNNQPSQYGILESIVIGTEVFQKFHTQPNGALFYRGSHAGDTTMPNWTAVATGAQVADTVRFQNVRVTNFSIGANTIATASNTYTVPSGFAYGGIMDVWCDNTGTTGGANTSNCVCTNHWGDSTSVYAAMRNFASSAAKITVQFMVMYVRNSY